MNKLIDVISDILFYLICGVFLIGGTLLTILTIVGLI